MGVIWNKSGSVEFDNNGTVAPGALAYFYIGNTTTPLAVFEEADESTPHDFPLEADGNGRWPDVFIPFIASYDVKVTTSGGTQLYYPQEIPNPNPVEAAEDTVEAAELFATGDVKFRHATGTLSGYVRCNGGTLGSAASGATERANADTSNLFSYLWNNFSDALLTVSGGRGGSAATDFAANKTIALFDMRCGAPIGVDGMGNSTTNRLSFTPFGVGSASTGGSFCGATTHTITEAQLPSHTHSVSITSGTESAAHTHFFFTSSATESQSHTHSGTTSSDGAHTHSYNDSAPTAAGSPFPNNSSSIGNADTARTTGSNGDHTHTMTTGNASQTHTHNVEGDTGNPNVTHTHLVSGTTGTGSGSGTAHSIVAQSITGTWYIKL